MNAERPAPADILSRFVRRDEVPEDGLAVRIAADAAARDRLAALLGIPSVASLDAELVVRRWRGDGLAVRGHFEGDVTQTCVVTLEPVDNSVAGEIDEFFAPANAIARVRREGTDAAEAGPGPDDVEPLEGGRIDLGALVVEHFALSLDPYPRCPGAAFDGVETPPDGENRSGPFSALGALRGRPGPR